jgi:hypothetical protein
MCEYLEAITYGFVAAAVQPIGSFHSGLSLETPRRRSDRHAAESRACREAEDQTVVDAIKESELCGDTTFTS